jgi:acetylornithine deacetylase/succinyl-diaminopimelate desuccinylase-like protein
MDARAHINAHARDVPSMCTGMRGLAVAEVTLTGPVRDLHSGSFGGGVPNPLHAMAALLAGLHDEAGRAVRAGRRAMERAFGREVLFTKEGGSGPEADLADILGAPLVFVGVGLDSDRPHAPNERIDLSLLLRGAEASAYLWEELATAGSDLT